MFINGGKIELTVKFKWKFNVTKQNKNCNNEKKCGRMSKQLVYVIYMSSVKMDL